MGYRVKTVGHIDVSPALNDAEFSYLTAFAESRRWTRPQGELWVPWAPFGFDEDRGEDSLDDYNSPPGDQPGLWCPWVPSCRGACLSPNGEDNDERSYDLTSWLKYLHSTFLKPNARAQHAPELEGFTFDHRLSGVVAAHRNDTGEMWLIRADGRGVRQEVLRKGDPWWAVA